MRKSLRVQLYSAAGSGDILGRGVGGGCRQATIARDRALAQAGVGSCGQPGSDPNTSRLQMLVFGGVSSPFLAAVEQMGALDRLWQGPGRNRRSDGEMSRWTMEPRPPTSLQVDLPMEATDLQPAEQAKMVKKSDSNFAAESIGQRLNPV